MKQHRNFATAVAGAMSVGFILAKLSNIPFKWWIYVGGVCGSFLGEWLFVTRKAKRKHKHAA